jgi:hypothetical protein
LRFFIGTAGEISLADKKNIERKNKMEWYWWVLIVAVLVAGAALKLKVLGMLMERRKNRESHIPQDE